MLAAKDVDGLLERAGDAGFALIAVLRDLLMLPASRSNGGAAGESLATAAASVAAVHDGLHGETRPARRAAGVRALRGAARTA